MEYDKTIKYGVEPFNIMTSDKAELFHRFESGYFSNKLSHYANITDSLSKGDIIFGLFTGVFNDLYRCRKDNDEDENFADRETPRSSLPGSFPFWSSPSSAVLFS